MITPTAEGMKQLLQMCEVYGFEHDIKYNWKKSAVIICRNTYIKNVIFSPFKINGEDIKEVKSIKYLGHFITDSLDDNDDIMRQCRQLYACACACA